MILDTEDALEAEMEWIRKWVAIAAFLVAVVIVAWNLLR